MPVRPTIVSAPTATGVSRRRRRDHQKNAPVSAMSMIAATITITTLHGEERNRIAITSAMIVSMVQG